MANNILEYNGHLIGKSIKEGNCKDIIDEIFKTSKKFNCSIIYPEDVVVGKNLTDAPKIKLLNEIENNDESYFFSIFAISYNCESTSLIILQNLFKSFIIVCPFVLLLIIILI